MDIAKWLQVEEGIRENTIGAMHYRKHYWIMLEILYGQQFVDTGPSHLDELVGHSISNPWAIV